MKIFVNGDEREVSGDPLSYADVFSLAYPGKQVIGGASIMYHWRGPGDLSRNGTIMNRDKSVKPEEGMIIDCMFTGNA